MEKQKQVGSPEEVLTQVVYHPVKVLKLITGEEVVGRVHREFGMVILEKPLMLQIIETQAGEDWSGTLVPWLKTSDDEIMSIPPEHVLHEGNPTTEVDQYYLATVVGIVLMTPEDVSGIVEFCLLYTSDAADE